MNTLNKLSQGFFELFKGPRTKDYEYDKIAQEYNISKERLLNLKSLIESYPSKLDGYKKTLDNLILSFEVVFDGVQGMYNKFINDVVTRHKSLNEKLMNMFTRIEGLKEEMEKWTKNCSTVDEKMKLREEKRKTFDHYDEKMGDLFEERQKIFAKGNKPTEKEEEKFLRNIKKYKDAANEYVVATNDAYKFMCLFLDTKYEIVSIGIAEFLDIELIFYHEAAEIFKYFQNIKRNVLTIKQTFSPPVRNYEASNFIRGKALLNLNIEDLSKDKTCISGTIGGKKDSSNINNNEQNNASLLKSNTYYYTDYLNNKNNINNNNKNTNPFQNQNQNQNNNNNTILNPYINGQNPPQASYNFYKANIDNSIPDPFNNNKNNQSFIPTNSYMDNKAPPAQMSKNPYSRGVSGDNPFTKPNI